MSKTVSNISRRRILDLMGEVARLKAAIRAKDAALLHCYVTAEERAKAFPADGYWASVRDTAGLALTPAEAQARQEEGSDA